MPRFFLFVAIWFVCAAFCEPAFSVQDKNSADIVQEKAQKKAEEPQKLRAESLMNYCTALSKTDQPSKGCGCLKDAYKDQVVRTRNTIVEKYNYWVRTLNEITKSLHEFPEPNVLSSVEAFCARWYSDVDSLQLGAVRTRDMVMLKTPEFKSEEERADFTRESNDLKTSTRGLSHRFCQANAEVAVYDKKMNEDPFGTESDSEVYQRLKFHVACRQNLRQ